jgi:enoyl-CoA hydratase/carnithine racemase
VQKKTQENTLVTNESNKDESITEQTLTELMSKRENFIHLLFKKKTTEEIAQEITLVNEMVSLDSELTSSSQACKKILAGQILRLKQGKKVSKSYQKY